MPSELTSISKASLLGTTQAEIATLKLLSVEIKTENDMPLTAKFKSDEQEEKKEEAKEPKTA